MIVNRNIRDRKIKLIKMYIWETGKRFMEIGTTLERQHYGQISNLKNNKRI